MIGGPFKQEFFAGFVHRVNARNALRPTRIAAVQCFAVCFSLGLEQGAQGVSFGAGLTSNVTKNAISNDKTAKITFSLQSLNANSCGKTISHSVGEVQAL